VGVEHVRRGSLGERGEFAAPLAKLITALAGALAHKQAQDDPIVKDLLKRFEADIVAREPGDRQAWQDRLS